MLGLLAAWLLFPAVTLIVCAGAGLLAERASGARLPAAMLLPTGMAVVICATQLTTYVDETAELTVPLVLVIVIAGLVLGWRRLRAIEPDRWGIGALLAVFAVFAAPVVLTGTGTFAGYTVLGDTANHFLGADAMLVYGREFEPLAPSTYEFALEGYFGINAYPAGGPTAIGALTRLALQDVAWTFQPFLALLVVFMGAALWSLIAPHVPSRRVRAAIVFVATQPALVLAYALQGSVKEVGTAYAVTVLAALVPVYASQAEGGARRAIPLAIAAAAAIGVVGPAAILWIGPLALAALAAALWKRWRGLWRPVLGGVAVFIVLTTVLSYQAVLTLATYIDISGGVVTTQAEFGNLLGPLDTQQKYGIWLVGDYRNEPRGTLWTINWVLIRVVFLGAVAGAVWAARKRAWAPAAFVAASLIAYVYVTRQGSPWADGKALMIVSPAVMLAAGLGAASLPVAWLRWGILAALAAGVVWSNAYQYHDSSPAPRERLEELADVGKRIDGEGLTLYPEFEEFAKHFLRHGDPEGSSEGFQRRYTEALDREGGRVPLGFTSDIDRFTDEYVTGFRTIVLRRGFEGSVPSSLYKRTWRGRFYEIWQREEKPARQLVEHLPLGSLHEPAAVLDCAQAERLGKIADARSGRLVAYERPVNPVWTPAATEPRPPAWFVDPSEATSLYITGPGRIEGKLEVTEPGEYELWIEASTVRPFEVRLDGRELPARDWQINGRGTSDVFGRLTLEAGTHTIELVRPGGRPWPGDGGYRRLGPVALMPPDRGGKLVELAPDQWRSLCGRSLDWAEIVA